MSEIHCLYISVVLKILNAIIDSRLSYCNNHFNFGVFRYILNIDCHMRTTQSKSELISNVIQRSNQHMCMSELEFHVLQAEISIKSLFIFNFFDKKLSLLGTKLI